MHCNYEIMKRKLLKSLVFGTVFVSPMVLFGQVLHNSGAQQKQTKQSASTNLSFDEYCEQYAVQLIDVLSEKLSGVKMTGTLNYIDSKKQPSLKAYGVKPAENETTYYNLNGSDKLLAVKSLYVLKLNYANAKN